MEIRLRVFGLFETYLGRQPVEVILPEGATLKQVYAHLNSNWQEQPPASIWDPASERFSIPHVVMIGGHDIQDEEQILSDGCEVFLIPPLEGG